MVIILFPVDRLILTGCPDVTVVPLTVTVDDGSNVVGVTLTDVTPLTTVK
jgi:hypothetical protein